MKANHRGQRSVWRGWVAGTAAVAAIAYPFLVEATVTVNPVEPYALNNGTIYYGGTEVTSSGGFADTGNSFALFNLGKGQYSDSSDRPNMIKLNVSTDKAFTAGLGSRLVVTVLAQRSNGSDFFAVPIAWAGGGDCVYGQNCQGDVLSTDSTYVNKFSFSARYTQGQTLQIGLYPSDICLGMYRQSGNPVASGCAADMVATITSGSPAIFRLKFVFGTVASDSGVGPTDSGQEQNGTAINLSFQSTAPYIECASDLTKIYFPGDQQILLDPANFVGHPYTGAAPVDKFVAVVKSGSFTAPTSYPTDATLNVLPFDQGSQGVGGFTNTTDGTDNKHTVYFSARDMAGVVGSMSTSCALTNVQTSTVEGFLGRSNCFIATAAFGAIDHPAVEILREFRDRVLLEFDWGRSFVDFYYSWSPDAAEWLKENPVARYAVLLALAPVEVLVWFVLNPWLGAIALVALAGGSALLVGSVRRRRASA